MPVRTRFAPSPTGYLHIGGVRTALFNWLFARQHGGQFILRIDDTDQQRNVAEALLPILDGFKWLGIDWDEGPTDDGQSSRGPHGSYFQSQRGERYQAAVDRLLASGHAYRDYATTEEVAAEREAAEKEKRPFVYSRRWASDTPEGQARQRERLPSVVRLKMPRTGACEFFDHVRGQMKVEWASEQDHVVQRADGSFIYHLANVVDDHDFEITHVIRAEEHLSNTPRQIFIVQCLGYELPQYAHVPFVAEPGGKTKLSKRKLDKYLKNAEFKKVHDHAIEVAKSLAIDSQQGTFNPVMVEYYRSLGYLPHAILNYLLLLGWSYDGSKEFFSESEMIDLFGLERINKASASFDPQKLLAFQDHYMRLLPIKQKVALIVPRLVNAGWLSNPPPCDIADRVRKVIEAAGDRIKIAGDISEYDYFFKPDDQIETDPAAIENRLGTQIARDRLARLKVRLGAVEPFDAAHTEAAVKQFVEDEGIKIGDIIHALRVAITGKAVGLGMFDSLEIIGKESCLRRIERVLTQ